MGGRKGTRVRGCVEDKKDLNQAAVSLCLRQCCTSSVLLLPYYAGRAMIPDAKISMKPKTHSQEIQNVPFIHRLVLSLLDRQCSTPTAPLRIREFRVAYSPVSD
jgi:hypothetical protein